MVKIVLVLSLLIVDVRNADVSCVIVVLGTVFSPNYLISETGSWISITFRIDILQLKVFG